MLNELFELNSSMEKAGITRSSWHNHYKECPTSTSGYYLMISSEGSASGLQLIKDIEAIRSMRKYGIRIRGSI